MIEYKGVILDESKIEETGNEISLWVQLPRKALVKHRDEGYGLNKHGDTIVVKIIGRTEDIMNMPRLNYEFENTNGAIMIRDSKESNIFSFDKKGIFDTTKLCTLLNQYLKKFGCEVSIDVFSDEDGKYNGCAFSCVLNGKEEGTNCDNVTADEFLNNIKIIEGDKNEN